MKKTIVLILSVFLLFNACKKDEKTGSITGVLKLESGEILAFSTVMLKSNDVTVKQVQTDDMGAFVINDIDKGDYTLVGEHTKYKSSKPASLAIEEDVNLSIDFIFEPIVSIEGTIIRSGTFFTSATVELYGDPMVNVLEYTQSDLEGGFAFYDLAPGVYHIEAFRDDVSGLINYRVEVVENETVKVVIGV